MKYIKLYENHNNIYKICEMLGIRDYTINSDGTVDVDGTVDMSVKKLRKIPINFRNVSGDFYCYENEITSLKGAPIKVGGNFNAGDNLLRTLKYAPEQVGSDFRVDFNLLDSLEYSPKYIGGSYTCAHNSVKTLKGITKYIPFYLNASYNQLETLEHSPIRVGRDFRFNNNKVYTFDNFPEVGGDLVFSNNPLEEIYKSFDDVFLDDLKEYIGLFNEYDMIREVDGKYAIIIDLFNEFLLDIDRETVSSVEGYITI